MTTLTKDQKTRLASYHAKLMREKTKAIKKRTTVSKTKVSKRSPINTQLPTAAEIKKAYGTASKFPYLIHTSKDKKVWKESGGSHSLATAKALATVMSKEGLYVKILKA